jgi:hypothetical protein
MGVFAIRAAVSTNAADGIDKFAKALKFLTTKQHEPAIHDVKDNERKFNMLMGGIYRQLAELAVQHPAETVSAIRDSGIQDLTQGIVDQGGSGSSSQGKSKGKEKEADISKTAERLEQRLCRRAFKAFHDSVKDLMSDACEKGAAAHLQLALFCDYQLKLQEDRETSGKTVSEEEATQKDRQKQAYAAIVVENILKAMKLQSTRAADRFPRLLELIAVTSNGPCKKLFVQNASQVPCWMFIRWISQMMALIDKEEGACVFPILTEIAKNYPQALYFPFRISTENLSLSETAGTAIAPLRKLLANPLLDQFVTSLEKLTHPGA